MSTGLIALLDDIAAIAKLAAAALDDAATQAAQAGSKAVSKAAGIVIDDAAVTPRYVVGLAAERELPIIAKIAGGSFKNKLLFLLPGALFINFFFPFMITPLLMIGGAFLCYEGWHKTADVIGLHGKQSQNTGSSTISAHENGLNPEELENLRVNGAIRTDFILSAEIMAITLATVSDAAVWLQATVLAVSGLGMTVMVYGAVAIIVKADDFGVYLARQSTRLVRATGRAIVFGMPIFLQLLSYVGMIAMLWVGGGILLHGLHVLGVHGPEDWVNEVGYSSLALIGSFGSWALKAGMAAVVGLIVGAIAEVLSTRILIPALFNIIRIFTRKS
jgi:predicted DNA repair protein MutK